MKLRMDPGGQSVHSVFGKRPKLGEAVTRYIRDGLMAGEFRPGQRMAPDEISKQLAVSTMPVREALVVLANEGLLEELPRRGFRVAPLSRADVHDLFRVHGMIAGLLAERAAETIDDKTLGQLQRNHEQIVQLVHKRMLVADRASQIEELNFEFHQAINRVPDARRLRWFLRAASRFIPRQFYEAIPEWIEETVRDHPPIIAALEARDALLAASLMETHVMAAGELVGRHLEMRGFWAATNETSLPANADSR